MNTSKEMNGGPKTPRDEMAGLLPFYLADGLDDADRARVEAWLESDEDGRRALRELEAERDAVVSANEAIAPPAGALGRLMEEIDKDPTPAKAASWMKAGVLQGVFDWLNATPASLAWAACAALLAVTVVQTSMLVNLSEPPVIASGNGQVLKAAIAIVMFKPSATAEAIADALDTAKASIVSGPTASGMYELRLKEDKALATVAKRIQELAGRKDVVQYVKLKGG